MRILAVVAMILAYAGGALAAIDNANSGVYGVVPNYQKDLAAVREEVEVDRYYENLKGNVHAENPKHPEAVLKDWKTRCVEAYYADSRVPSGYSLSKHQGQTGAVTAFGLCNDPVKFPRGYMRVAAATGCNADGSFRLPLKPGNYVIFVGREEGYDRRAPGQPPWHQIISLAAYQWTELSKPESADSCRQDSDCSYGYSCRESEWPTLTRLRRFCQPILDVHGPFTSGVRGRIGMPPKYCVGVSMIPLDQEHQCIAAFTKDNSEMAACAACQDSDDSFALPLKPGAYILRYPNAYYDPNQHSEEREIEIKRNEWVDLYLMGAKPGPVKPPCWGGWVE